MSNWLNTNVTAVFAARSLAGTQSLMSESVQRLSSGIRINTAKDDAAGLGISQELQRQTRSLEIASRNTLDALSIAQTAEGALANVSDMLLRLRELATRGATDSLSKDQRQLIADEILQIRNEINAVANNTRFNGTRLLTGDFSHAVSGDFVNSTGEISAEELTVNADTTFKLGAVSRSALTGASEISLFGLDSTNAKAGTYQFSNDGEYVTLTRTLGTEIESQTIALSTSGGGKNVAYLSPVQGELFALNFDELGIRATYQIDTLGTLKSANDFANLVTSVGSIASASGTWTDVAGADFATGDSSDPVTAIVTATGATVKIATTTGLTTVSGYGAAGTWTDGSATTMAFTGTVSQVNAALATLQSNSPSGFGDIQIAITAQFSNSSFSSTVGSTNGAVTTYEGWQVYEQRVKLGQTSIAGFTSPTDPTPKWHPSSGNHYLDGTVSGTYDHAMSTTEYPVGDSGTSLKLFNSLSLGTYDGQVIHGPYVVSRDPVEILANDKVSFDWRAVGGGDAFDVFAYIVRVGEDGVSGDGATQVILNRNSGGSARSTSWANEEITVSQSGFYKFVFVAGAYDETNGGALDAALYVDNVTVKPVNARPGTLKSKNLSTGATFTVDNAIQVSSVATSGIGNGLATDGIYKLSADESAKTVTLNLYDEDSTTLLKTQTVTVKDELGSERYKNLTFDALGVSLRLTNLSNESIRLGNVKSGLNEEVIVTQNRRASLIASRGFAFQTGASRENETVLNVFSDIRLGDNQNTRHGAVFNQTSSLIDHLATASDSSTDDFKLLGSLVESAITTIASQRSMAGTSQNRLESALGNIQEQFQSLNSARSSISDTDYASETARLTKIQIGQQASVAMLAQANQLPNVILALLE